MSEVLFSIVMPAFNAESTLYESVCSVLNQTFTNFELIIVDDCSVDGTRDLIKQFLNSDDRVRAVFLEVNSGVAVARNSAINNAVGRYIAFLDADDLWMKDKLSKQYGAFLNGADVVYSDYVRFYKDNTEKKIISPSVINFNILLNGNCIGNLTAAYDAKKIGKFYQEPIGHEDYLMWLKIFKVGVTAERIPEVLSRYRVSSTSVSSNKLKAIFWTWSIYRHEINLGFFSSLYHFFRYVVSALLKRV